MKILKITLLSFVVTAVAACGGKKDEEGGGEAEQAEKSAGAGEQAGGADQAAAADPKAEAEKIFNTNCATCHGKSGKGDGPGAASLDPKPRNYTDAEWQESVTDEQLRETIVKGGAGVGKSPAMPPNPQLANKPEVLDALVEHIRSFAP